MTDPANLVLPKLGFVLPNRVVFQARAYVEIAQAAEGAGYHSIWTTDHVIIPAGFESPYPFTPDGKTDLPPTTPYVESLTLLAFLAGVTSSIRLGTAVIPIITRSPLFLAKHVASVDVLSGGRVELGLGAGWLGEEATAMGLGADRRMRRLRETVDILRLAWSKPSFKYEGRVYEIPEVGVHPHPIQGESLPIWIGGHGEASIRMAATAGGFLAWAPPATQLLAMRDQLREANPSARIAVSVVSMAGETEKTRDDVAELAAVGVDLILILHKGTASQIQDFLTEALV